MGKREGGRKLEEGSRLADAVYRDTVLNRKGGEGRGKMASF